MLSNTHVVIQAPGLGASLIEQAAAIASCAGLHRISHTATRLLNVSDDSQTKADLVAWGDIGSWRWAYTEYISKCIACGNKGIGKYGACV